MVENIIIKLFEDKNVGKVTLPITPVSGGFMHRMYRVDTTNKSYAVKHLNPVIMQRPGAKDNYKRAEALEKKLEEAGIPIVPATTIDGAKMQECQGEFFYIFDWKEGKITDWNNITDEYDCGFSDYDKTFGVAYTWIEWLEYNISRALGNCQDEAECQMGINEVKNTVARIAYIREMEDTIKQNMNLLPLM